MARTYFSHGVFSAFGSSGSLDNASNNPGVMSTNDVNVESIADMIDVATDNAMTYHAGTSYNYSPATNNQMPVLHGQDVSCHDASASMAFGGCGVAGIVEPPSASLVVEDGFASASSQTPNLIPQNPYWSPALPFGSPSATSQTPSFVPQHSCWSSEFPFEAINFGHPRYPLGSILSSYSAYNQGALSGVAEGMQSSSLTDGRSFATGTFAEVPTGTTRTYPPSVSYTNMAPDAARSLPIREVDSNQGTYNDLSMLYHTSNGSSNSMVADYNGSTDTERPSDMRHNLQRDLDPGMQISGPISYALPGETFVTRELARCPERPSANGGNKHNLKNKPRQTSRKNKKRSQQEQDTRDKGSCRQCKSQKKLVSSLLF
jgi:hypothetical protein